MGNAIAIEPNPDPESMSTSNSTSDESSTVGPLPDMEALASNRPLLLRKASSSFLDEPITRKHTERGEASVTVGSGEASNGREGSEGDSAGKMRYAVSEMQGWRSHMEDKHALNPQLSTNKQQVELLKDHHLFAVFDGHGGDFASHFCGEHLVETLTSQKDWTAYVTSVRSDNSSAASTKNASSKHPVQGLQLLKAALTSAFLELDAKLMAAQRQRRLDQLYELETMIYSMGGSVDDDVFVKGSKDHQKIINFDKVLPPSMPANIQLERSGSTGVVVLVTPHHIICANAGDSRAILSRKDEVLPLSFDHKPTNDVEVTRVEKDGGFVRVGRVDGDLAVSRSFGDFGYKNCRERDAMEHASAASSWLAALSAGMSLGQPQEHRVTVQPDILVHTREPSRDEFVVLACDGIWDRMTNKDCSDLVRSLVRNEGETDVGLICEEVMDAALELDSRDNMTVLLAVFPAANMKRGDNIGGSGSRPGGVRKRRYVREKSWGSGSTPAGRAALRMEERRRRHREILAGQAMARAPKQGRRSRPTTPSKPLATSAPGSKSSSAASVAASASVSSKKSSSGTSSSSSRKKKASNPPPRSNSASSRTRGGKSKSLRIQMESTSRQ